MTGHGFRGLAATILRENSFEEEHIELQHPHQKRNKVAAAYSHARYLKQRKSMMQWWADFLDAQFTKGRESTPGVNAIPAAPDRKKTLRGVKQPIENVRELRPTV